MPDNDLAVLPAAIANLINLRELDVSKNSKGISCIDTYIMCPLMFNMVQMMLGRYSVCQVVLQGCSITASVVAIT